MQLSDALNWRYATKAFDPSKKVPEDVFDQIMEAARLAPSSFGLELWRFVVVGNAELREKIQASAWNQSQVTEASHLVVLCQQADVTPTDVDALMKRMGDARGLTDLSALDGYKQMILGTVNGLDEAKKASWMGKQVYLALGFLMAEAAELGIDTCPMEGFDPVQVDKILELDKLGLKSTVLCPIGYRRADDKYASLSKVRRSKEEVLVRIA